MKNLIFLPKAVFDSSKEASWGTERKAKTPSSYQSMVSEKIKKYLHKRLFLAVLVKNGHFWCFFFQKPYLLKNKLVFFELHSVHQVADLELSKTAC